MKHHWKSEGRKKSEIRNPLQRHGPVCQIHGPNACSKQKEDLHVRRSPNPIFKARRYVAEVLKGLLSPTLSSRGGEREDRNYWAPALRF